MMRNNLYVILIALVLFSCHNFASPKQELMLLYNSPAKIWEETLPLGNGRIGMMPDGGVDNEHIVLNDISMWSGSEDSTALNPEAINYLPEIQELLLSGKNAEAQSLMYEHFRCGGQGSAFGNGKDAPYGCFQMLGDLNIQYLFSENDSITGYKRKLSLNDAVAETTFSKGGTAYKREYFASFTNDVLVIHLTADKKQSISFETALNRPERATISVDDDMITMEGQLNDGHNSDKGVRYLTKLQVLKKGGLIMPSDSTLMISDADEVIILVSSSTDLLNEDYKTAVENLLAESRNTPFDKLKKLHIKAFKEKFERVKLDLGVQDNSLPTNDRLANFQKNDDSAFAALYFQFGRYLMISGTNEKSMPLNLQGLWANRTQTPWNGDYHLNINVQMNYWPAEVCNLPELHRPLLEFTKNLVPSGEKTAKTFYGAEGWTAHMMSNPWNYTAPGEHASWGATNTGGAWLCQHLWEHYAFSQDTEYLKSVYPTLKGAADFFLTAMIKEPKHNWLVTAPSSSPENGFFLPGSNNPVFVCMGPTMDVQIINELFINVLFAAQILGIEDNTTAGIRETLPQLPPMQISSNGYLQEWLEDYEEAEPQHRHVSHLYGLYPSNQISPDSTPELAAAARETLERRGDEGTGWSRAWKINFWARLHDGNRAYKLLKSLLEPSVKNQGGGTYPNLFCAHPPFQIDGNFGGTAGIAEMLIQSQNGYLEILPALPDNWKTGKFKGLRVRGGAEVGVIWENGKAKTVKITASTNNSFKIKVPDYTTSISLKGKKLKSDNGFVKVTPGKGKTIKLVIK